jgi:hypothetical protein
MSTDVDATGGPVKWTEWSESFTIFAKYSDGSNDHTAAEHDEVFSGPDPDVVSREDVARLEALGWRADAKLGCFCRFV